MDNLIGGAAASGLARRLLDDEELLLMRAEKPPTFAKAERYDRGDEGHRGRWDLAAR
jgi:hypothetical protein